MGIAQNAGDPPPKPEPSQNQTSTQHASLTAQKLRQMRLKAMQEGKLVTQPKEESKKNADEQATSSASFQKLQVEAQKPELKQRPVFTQKKQIQETKVPEVKPSLAQKSPQKKDNQPQLSESSKSPQVSDKKPNQSPNPSQSPSPEKKKDFTPEEHRDNIVRKIFQLPKKDELYELQDLDSYLIENLQTIDFKSNISRPAYLYSCFDRMQGMSKITDYISMDQKMDIERTICLYFKHLFVDYELLAFQNPVIAEQKITTQNQMMNPLQNLIPPHMQQNPELGGLFEMLENLPQLAHRHNKVQKFQISTHHKYFLMLVEKSPKVCEKEGFLTRIVQYTMADGGLGEVTMIFEPLFRFIQFQLVDTQPKDILTTAKIERHLNILYRLICVHQTVAQIFTESQAFLKQKQGQLLFTHQANLLALPLRISAFPNESKEVLQTRCQQVLRTKNPKPVLQSIRKPLNSVLSLLAEILQYLLQLSPISNKRALQWLRGLANFNLDKLKMYGDQQKFSSDGVIINAVTVALILFRKYYNAQQKNMDINFRYCLKFSPERINLNSPNVINLDKRKEILEKLDEQVSSEQSKEEFTKTIQSQTSVTTQLFFVIHTLLHQFEPFLEKYLRNEKNMQTKLNNNLPRRVAMDVQIQSELFVQNLFRFFGLTSFKIMQDCILPEVKEAYKNKLNQDTLLNLVPIPAIASVAQNVSILPTLVLQNIRAYCQFFAQVHPLCFPQNRLDADLINALYLLVMGSEDLVTNPHLRAQFIFLMVIVLPQESKNPRDQFLRKRNEIFEQIFIRNQFMLHHGIQIFFKLFSDVQRTGQDNEFYQKFKFRNMLCSILYYYLHKSGQKAFHQRFIVDVCQRNQQIFVRYCTYILNDLIYFTDEIFQKLARVKEIEDQESQGNFDMQQVIQRQHEKQTLERRLQIENELINIMIKVLRVTVHLNPKAFEAEEVLEKFASAINYTVDVLVTKKGVKLKVQNPQKYKFFPIQLLSNYLEIYVEMAHSQKFKEEVIKDQRAYSDEMFQKIIKLVFIKHIIPGPGRFGILKELAEELKELKKDLKVEEDYFEDAPDEFRDAIMDTIMENPVLLPSSKAVVDYMTIKKHLINVQEDPFNREKLTLNMIEELPELRQKIQNYKKEKMEMKKKKNI